MLMRLLHHKVESNPTLLIVHTVNIHYASFWPLQIYRRRGFSGSDQSEINKFLFSEGNS